MPAEVSRTQVIREKKLTTNYVVSGEGQITGATQRSTLNIFKPDLKCRLGEIYLRASEKVSVYLNLKPTRPKDISSIEILHNAKKEGSTHSSVLRICLSNDKKGDFIQASSKALKIIEELKVKGVDVDNNVIGVYLDWDQNSQKFRVGGQLVGKRKEQFLTEPLLTIDDINVVDLEINPTHIHFSNGIFSLSFIRGNKSFNINFKSSMLFYPDSSIKKNELLVPIRMQTLVSNNRIQQITGIPAYRFLCTDYYPDLGDGTLYSLGSSGSYSDSIRVGLYDRLSLWDGQKWEEANPQMVRDWAKKKLREVNLERMKQMLNPKKIIKTGKKK